LLRARWTRALALNRARRSNDDAWKLDLSLGSLNER
jgi:hypothetical protein